jgi:hypothetical protein
VTFPTQAAARVKSDSLERFGGSGVTHTCQPRAKSIPRAEKRPQRRIYCSAFTRGGSASIVTVHVYDGGGPGNRAQ